MKSIREWLDALAVYLAVAQVMLETAKRSPFEFFVDAANEAISLALDWLVLRA